MENSDRFSDRATKRIGIFANGKAGYSCLEKLLAYAPESVIALITDNEAIPDEFDIPEGCEAKLWQE